MATARNENFDYLLEMHCTLYINPEGFINPEAHIEVSYNSPRVVVHFGLLHISGTFHIGLDVCQIRV